MGNSVRTIVATLVAGGVSAYIAIAGDGDGLHVTDASRFASGYVPYVVIVVLLGGTAPGVLHAVVRAAGSQLIMVWGYYTWGPMTNFEQTPTKATHLAAMWSAIALTAVPAVALGAFAVGWSLRAAVRSVPAGSGPGPTPHGRPRAPIVPPPGRAAGSAPDAPDRPGPPGSHRTGNEANQGTGCGRTDRTLSASASHSALQDADVLRPRPDTGVPGART